MVYKYLRNLFIIFLLGLNIFFFTPSLVNAAISYKQLEQDAISKREKMVLVQYVNKNNLRRMPSMSEDENVQSRYPVNPEVDIVELRKNVDVAEYIRKLKQDPQVRYAEPNHKLQLFDVPNDPYYSKQWALAQVQAIEAWELLPPEQHDVVVAVIDSGIDTDNPDLSNRIFPGGYNFLLENADISDIEGHGTAVAGVIASETNNGIGIAGIVGPARVKILPLKTADSTGQSYVSDVIKAIDFAIQQRVDIINLSMGNSQYSAIENAAIQRAIQSGICVIASAGNDGNSAYNYPASYEGVISVGSIASNHQVSYFSNYNDKVDLTAPGEDVYSCSCDGNYRSYNGTSFSAPVVSGISALLRTADPTLGPTRIEEILENSATDYGNPGRDLYYGYGVVNALSALKQVKVAVNSITLDKETLELRVGESCILKPSIYPANASDHKIAWASDQPGVATVDANGKVTAISEGHATIIAISADGGKTASCLLSVTSDYIPVNELQLERTKLLLQVGETYTLKASVYPFNASIKGISWATDNPEVATVDSSGTVKANAVGATTIIAITTDGGKTGVCQLNVLKVNLVNSVIDLAPGNVEPSLSDNKWVLQLKGTNLKSQLNADDILLSGMPDGLNSILNVTDDSIIITVVGQANKPITVPSSVELILRGSAFEENWNESLSPLIMTIEPVADCFIATAAYGSYLDPHVYVLRQFRNQVLLHSTEGRWLVEEYYRHSPEIAVMIARNTYLRILTLALLTPIIFGIQYSWLSIVILTILLLLLFIIKRPLASRT